MSSSPLTRRDLDRGVCMVPGCDHTDHDGLFLHGRCHISAPTTCEYRREGVLRVTCSACGKLVAEIAVAP